MRSARNSLVILAIRPAREPILTPLLVLVKMPMFCGKAHPDPESASMIELRSQVISSNIDVVDSTSR